MRVDAGVESGDEISRHYDPMIAKLIVHAPTRDEAIAGLSAAIAATAIDGPVTNLDFLGRLVAHPGFARDAHDTGFIAREAETLLPNPPVDRRLTIAAGLIRLALDGRDVTRVPSDPFSPFATAGAWTMNAAARRVVTLTHDGTETELAFATDRAGTRFLDEAGTIPVSARLDGERATVTIGDLRLTARFSVDGAALTLATPLGRARFVERDPYEAATAHQPHADRLVAPMPGSVVQVLVAPGTTVTAGTPRVVVEAMKMEHVVRAPHDGVVETIRVAVGDVVADGFELAVMAVEA